MRAADKVVEMIRVVIALSFHMGYLYNRKIHIWLLQYMIYKSTEWNLMELV